ncbi:MAG: leucyl aminopeptidase [Halobacteriovoraceae bacterium]|jgi:leucyl aminopeptidase|nr:leucyl aminopeptidase [Halobacteriovoraceae bacterium]
MNIHYDFETKHFESAEVKVLGAYSKGDKVQQTWSDKELVKEFNHTLASKNFTAAAGTSFSFTQSNGATVLIIGMGEKSKVKAEGIRRAIARGYKQFCGKKYNSVALDAASFNAINKLSDTVSLINESINLTSYHYDKYLSKKTEHSFAKICVYINDKKIKRSLDKVIATSDNITNSVNFARDLVNEVPNVLHSEEYADRIEAEVKTTFKGKGVKLKVLGMKELQKEKMGLFLSVNAGSAYDPRLVHLTYTPKKATKNTKHYALVGKGLTFDTGGYSLKPGGSMVGMKFDMGGSATVYGAFRAAVLNDAPYKITCILGMTDNAVNESATTPDAVVTARNGKTVEILNTDAEGRLVLADCLDYACDLKPDYIIDAATLTGACLVALGTEVCAVLGNNDAFTKKVLTSAKNQDEYMWQLPIIPEWKDDMKSKIADLKNIGSTRFGGTATAAAFLNNFIKDDIKWAHLDIAGVCTSQKHLPYCPASGGSGLIIRSLHHLLTSK